MKKLLWSIFEMVETAAIALIAVFLIRTFVAQPFLVSGSSMEPTFSNGNYLLIDELSYHFREPFRGEVVVFKYPGDHRSYYIKRIIGLPGEKVVVDRGKVTVSGVSGEKLLEEPYTAPHGESGGYFEISLGPTQYFVMGDNRNFSFDSRSWGPLDRADITGVVRFRLWPITKAMAFSAPAY